MLCLPRAALNCSAILRSSMGLSIQVPIPRQRVRTSPISRRPSWYRIWSKTDPGAPRATHRFVHSHEIAEMSEREAVGFSVMA